MPCLPTGGDHPSRVGRAARKPDLPMTAPRPGLLFEHVVATTGYTRPDGSPEPITYEVTEVTDDGRVYYGPAQRGIPTVATLWTWSHLFDRDVLGAWVGDRAEGTQ